MNVKAGMTEVIDLSMLFDFANDGSTIAYTLDTPAEQVMTVALDNGMLNVTAPAASLEQTVQLHATQRGRTQHLRLTLTSDNSTGVTIVKVADAEGVSYVNAMGQISDTPWNGVNIVVTRHADGTVSTAKRVF